MEAVIRLGARRTSGHRCDPLVLIVPRACLTRPFAGPVGCWTPFRRPKDELEEIIAKKDANVECNVSQLDSIFPRTTWRRRWMSRLGLGSMHLCKNAVELRRKMTLTRMSPTCNVAAHRLVTETTRCARSTSATATQGTEAPVFLKFRLLRASVVQILTTYSGIASVRTTAAAPLGPRKCARPATWTRTT